MANQQQQPTVRRFSYLLGPSSSTSHIHNTASIMKAAQLNNSAMALERSGNLAGAEAKYIAALEAKIKGAGVNSSQAALSSNALGELYLKMGKLEEAKDLLEHAEKVRSGIAPDLFDMVCTRDNLGRLAEMQGDSTKAVEWRTKGEKHQMICSYFECPKSANCQFSDRADLKMCKKCKCAFYCDQKCQKSDWRRHKQFCHENENSATYIEVARSRAGMGEAYFELPEHQGLD